MMMMMIFIVRFTTKSIYSILFSGNAGKTVLLEKSEPTLETKDTLWGSIYRILGRMLHRGDCNPNLMRIYTDSLKEVLKQAMLEHDTIFRRQVHELHRLYNHQKILMADLSLTDFNRQTSRASAKMTQTSFPGQPKSGRWVEGKAFGTFPVVDLTQSEDEDLLEERDGTYSILQQRTFDLQLPADDYINLVGKEHLEIRNSSVSPFDSFRVKNSHSYDHVSNQDEAKLSLGTGMYLSSEGSTSKTSCNEQVSLSIKSDIRSEQAIRRVSKEVAKPQLSINYGALMTHGEKIELQRSVSSDSSFSLGTRNDQGQSMMEFFSLEACCETLHLQEKNFFTLDTGSDECPGTCPSIGLLIEKGLSITSKETYIDLNRIQLDESSNFSNAGVAKVHSPAASSSTLLQARTDECHKEIHMSASWWRQPNNSCSSKISKLLKQDNVTHLASTDFGEMSTDTQISSRSLKLKASSGGDLDLMDLEENVCSLGQRCTITCEANPVVTSNSNVVNHPCSSIIGRNLLETAAVVENGHVSSGKSVDDAVSSSQCPVISYYDCIQEKSFSQSLMKSKDQDELQQEEKEMHDLVLVAAESLIKISMEKSECSTDKFSNTGTQEIAEQSEEESSDSYESIVLKLKDSTLDDYLVTSMWAETVETEHKGSRVTLRRGTRMKDFQKDILPSLVSLSRREIYEDMYSFGGDVRSKEFRKNRSKKATGGNWCLPRRNRRMKLGNVPQRNYS